MLNYSENYKKIIENAKRSSDGLVQPANLLKGIMMTPESTAYRALEYLNLRPNVDLPDIGVELQESYKVTSFTENILKQSELEAVRLSSKVIKSEHLLLAIVRANSIENIKVADIEIVIDKITKEDSDNGSLTPDGNVDSKSSNKGKQTILDKFCINLNDKAKEGKLDPIIGREKEMQRIEQILSRRKKNNPVLIGEAGVGKTAIIEGLAQRIVNGDVNEYLIDKKILVMDMNSIVAGTKFRGEFEERIKKIIDEIIKDKNFIVYIDEIHTIVGAGSSQGALDAANILKPALSRGEFSCIGSTTMKEYRQIEKDGALERRFQKVIINEPTMDETKKILYSLKNKYEDFHGVVYSDDVMSEFLSLSNRYMNERKFPDKAIDIMDEVGSYAKIRRIKSEELLQKEKELEDLKNQKIKYVEEQLFEKAAATKQKEKVVQKEVDELMGKLKENKIAVTKEDVFEVTSVMTNIPSKNITENEIDKFIQLEKNIKSVFVGQDESVDKITKALIRNKAGLGNSKKPIGVFLFLGQTGVGKTYLTKLLSKNLFNSEDDYIRVDMSEYMEKQSVSRLIGASPGYVGYEEGGQLTEKVRRKPYSIILLDEIEKAHADVWNILLQIFDDGVLTDSQGRTVNFKNTVIIMTSNIGSKKAVEFGTSIGFNSQDNDKSQSIVDKELKSKFSPEFLNRIDDIIKFNSLTEKDVKGIIDIELNNFSKLLLDTNDVTINFSESVKDLIFKKGWDAKMGARPIKRTIQHLVEDEVSLMVLSKKVNSGDEINSECKDGDSVITFTIVNKKKVEFNKKNLGEVVF
jgi:ATP-dependent Clp protease ATP-binding subunit ClpC